MLLSADWPFNVSDNCEWLIMIGPGEKSVWNDESSVTETAPFIA